MSDMTEHAVREVLRPALADGAIVWLRIGSWGGRGSDFDIAGTITGLDDCVDLSHKDGTRSSFSLNIVREAVIVDEELTSDDVEAEEWQLALEAMRS